MVAEVVVGVALILVVPLVFAPVGNTVVELAVVAAERAPWLVEHNIASCKQMVVAWYIAVGAVAVGQAEHRQTIVEAFAA